MRGSATTTASIGARDGDVDAVAVEDERKPARTRIHRNWNRAKGCRQGFQSLKLVHAPDASVGRERALKGGPGRCKGDEQKVLQGERPRAASLAV